MAKPAIYFHIPYEYHWEIPNLSDPDLWPKILEAYPSTGHFSWQISTWFELSRIGYPCSLTTELPDEGIVVIGSLLRLPPDQRVVEDIRPGPRLTIVSTKSDKAGYPWAQLHVIQNRADRFEGVDPGSFTCHYMPHWPQACLVPRSPDRGDRFERIVFMGRAPQLAPDFHAAPFREGLAALGLTLDIVDVERKTEWNDYSEADGVLAVRPPQDHGYPSKPASKLFNAWHAGVPAIVGPETAFQGEKKSDLDYLEVRSAEEALRALQRLRDDPELRRRMSRNALERAKETERPRMTERWRDFLDDVVVPAHESWCASSRQEQKAFFDRRAAHYAASRPRRRLASRVKGRLRRLFRGR